MHAKYEVSFCSNVMTVKVFFHSVTERDTDRQGKKQNVPEFHSGSINVQNANTTVIENQNLEIKKISSNFSYNGIIEENSVTSRYIL